MKHDCPYCGVSLRLRLVRAKPIAGERKIFPRQAVPVCPACDGALMTNVHWSEGVAAVVMFATLLAVPVARGLVHTEKALVLGAGIIVGWALMLVFFHWCFWRHWPRYKKAPAFLKQRGQ